jgi:predicted ATPase
VLTRLQINGFKNLVDVDVRFGPFTCIAGPNGVGKSNLFDAIRFLSSLADKPFVDAAKCVRDESRRTGEVRALFHQRDGEPVERMRFVAEMIVPKEGADQLGLAVQARTTFLRYTLELGFVPSGAEQLGDRLELLSEELTYVKPAEQGKALPFPHSEEWRKSAVIWQEANPRRSPYISTGEEKGVPVVYMHADGSTHKKTPLPAKQLTRTLLSATSLESPTAALARLEMRSWRLLQLEPSSLRAPDDFGAEDRLTADGAHLPATLYRLAHRLHPTGHDPDPTKVYAGVGSRLQELIRDIRHLDVDRDEVRRVLTLMATDRRGVRLPARSLSDGTLRFLALSVLEADKEAVGVLCFEEPENGIHPARIPAMLELLQDVAVDPDYPVGPGNPLRQVIVNTHSPAVLNEVYEGALLGAISEEHPTHDGVVRRVNFLPLSDTWRSRLKPKPRTLPLGDLRAYLHFRPDTHVSRVPANGVKHLPKEERKVRDRKDMRDNITLVASYPDDE